MYRDFPPGRHNQVISRDIFYIISYQFEEKLKFATRHK